MSVVAVPYIRIEADNDGEFRYTAYSDSISNGGWHKHVTSTLDEMFQQLNRWFKYDEHLCAYMTGAGVVVGRPSLDTNEYPIAEGNPVEIYKQLVPHLHMMRRG